MFLFSLFFFFKQKTAYEMRISDWSSDVCSSDLQPPGARISRFLKGRLAHSISAAAGVSARGGQILKARLQVGESAVNRPAVYGISAEADCQQALARLEMAIRASGDVLYEWDLASDRLAFFGDVSTLFTGGPPPVRSDEHTSELQS